MPRLVGAQNPHRKVPRAARGGTHGVRVSQSSQHPSRTRPSSALARSFSALAVVSRSPLPPTARPHPRRETRGDRVCFLFFTGERGKCVICSASATQRKRRNDPLWATASPGSPGACAAAGVGAAAGHVRGGAAGPRRGLPASFCGVLGAERTEVRELRFVSLRSRKLRLRWLFSLPAEPPTRVLGDGRAAGRLAFTVKLL